MKLALLREIEKWRLRETESMTLEGREKERKTKEKRERKKKKELLALGLHGKQGCLSGYIPSLQETLPSWGVGKAREQAGTDKQETN